MLAVTELVGFGVLPQEVVVPATTVAWNPADKDADVTLSNDDHDATTAAANHNGVRATLSRSVGAYYFEIIVVEASDGNNTFIGLADATTAGTSLIFPGGYANSIGSRGSFGSANGTITLDGVSIGGVESDNDVFQCAVDLDNGHVWLGKNNAWSEGITPVVASSSGRFGHFTPPLVLFPVGSVGFSAGFSTIARIRTLAADLTHTPPSGFTAWAG